VETVEAHDLEPKNINHNNNSHINSYNLVLYRMDDGNVATESHADRSIRRR